MHSRIALYAVVTLGALVMLFPYAWTVITSITTAGTLAECPMLVVEDPTLHTYHALFDTIPMWRIVANSFAIAVSSSLLQLITGSMAAYGFARLDFPGKRFAFVAYLATLMIPLQVLVVPLFIEMTRLEMNDTYFA